MEKEELVTAPVGASLELSLQKFSLNLLLDRFAKMYDLCDCTFDKGWISDLSNIRKQS